MTKSTRTRAATAAPARVNGIRLAIPAVVAFDVRFSINAEGTEHQFGFRAEADRVPAATEGETIGDHMARANLRMTAWLADKSPLVDGAGAPAAPGPDALQALYTEVTNLPGIVYAAMLVAMQARAVPVVP